MLKVLCKNESFNTFSLNRKHYELFVSDGNITKKQMFLSYKLSLLFSHSNQCHFKRHCE